MSQAGLYDDSATPSPDIETLTGDSGGPVGPTAGNINVFGVDATTNNDNGITTVGTPGSSLLEVTLTNRIGGTATTVGATTETVYTFPLGATAGTYLFWTRVVAFNITDSITASYASYRSIRTDGAAGTLIGASTAFIEEETGMEDASAVNDISGNSATFDVEGIAGKTINWNVLTEYIFIGA